MTSKSTPTSPTPGLVGECQEGGASAASAPSSPPGATHGGAALNNAGHRAAFHRTWSGPACIPAGPRPLCRAVVVRCVLPLSPRTVRTHLFPCLPASRGCMRVAGHPPRQIVCRVCARQRVVGGWARNMCELLPLFFFCTSYVWINFQ